MHTTRSGQTLLVGIMLLWVVPCSAWAQRIDRAGGSAPAATKESSVTVYGGYRFAGSLTDAKTGATVNLESNPSGAVAIDIGLDPQGQLQLFYSRQATAFTGGPFSPKANNLDFTLHTYHLGGVYFLEEAGHGIYVVGGIGATNARPGRGNLNAETFLSGNLGIGWMLPLGRHAGLRFEARGYGILVNNDSALFCGSNVGCNVAIKGDAIYQVEALVGFSVRF